jgi:hypothetical protein
MGLCCVGESPVGPKHFQNKARREWWSIHVEASQRSGLSQRSYCRIHRRTDTTFTRWLRAITEAEAAKLRVQNAKILAETERDERRRQRGGDRSTDGEQTQPSGAGVLGDACGDAELERDDAHALCRGDEALEVQPAPL